MIHGMSVLFLFITGALVLGMTTTALFEGPTRTVAVLVEALWVCVVGRHMLRSSTYIPVLAAPLLVPVVLSLSSVSSPAWRTGLVHGDALVLVLMIVASVLVALHFSQLHTSLFSLHKETLVDLEHTAWIVAGIYGLVLVWLSSHALVPTNANQGTLIAVLAYIFVASLFYMIARVTRARWQHATAATLAGLAVSLLFILEPSRMSTWEISTAILVVGSMLASVAWLERDMLLKRAWWNS